LEKEPAHQCSQWCRRSRQSKTLTEDLSSHGRRNESLQQRGFYRHIRSPGARSQSETQERQGQRMEDHQRAKEASPQESDQRLAQPWPEPGSNETGEQRADQCSYPKARLEQAVSLDSSMQDLVAVERQGCFERTIREKEEH
jgi:hypothetical protein